MAVTDSHQNLKKEVEFMKVEIEAIMLRFKKKMPVNKKEEIETTTQEETYKSNDMFVPSTEGI